MNGYCEVRHWDDLTMRPEPCGRPAKLRDGTWRCDWCTPPEADPGRKRRETEHSEHAAQGGPHYWGDNGECRCMCSGCTNEDGSGCCCPYLCTCGDCQERIKDVAP